MGLHAAGPALALALSGAPARAQSASAAVTFLPIQPGYHCGGISGDGEVIYDCHATWRSGTVETITDGLDYIYASSRDASVLVGGQIDDPAFDDQQGFIWTRAGGLQRLAVSALEPVSSVDGVSTDGKYFAVSTLARPASANFLGHDCDRGLAICTSNVYRYSAAGGYESIGQLGTRPASMTTWGVVASGMSGDGNTIVGNTYVDSAGGPVRTAFIWRAGAGISALPPFSRIPGINSVLGAALPPGATAFGISRDGSTTVGSSTDATSIIQAVYWRGGTITGLGLLPGTNAATLAQANFGSEAIAANADGSIIIGNAGRALDPVTFLTTAAFRWTAATGMQDLNVIARNAGLSLDGYTLSQAGGISDDGTIIVGRAEKNFTNANGFLQRDVVGFALQLAQITRSQLIVQIRLPGVTLTSLVNQKYATEVLATLNGAQVFARTVADRVDSTAGASAFADARAALGTSALRRISIGAPTLVSTSTTTTNSSSTTADVLTATQITTATVNATGPATVVTGDRGICATAAANGVDPTGCSLAGTPVAVPAGTLNANIYTNTIQSLTPTTTVTVDQLIAAKWQIAGVGGNQFGTVHALVGPAAFASGNRLAALLLSRGGAALAPMAAGMATPASQDLRDAPAFEGSEGLALFGGYHNDRVSIDADPSVPVASVRGSADGFTLGIEKAFSGGFHAGLAVDHGTARYRVADPAFPETLDQSLTQIAGFAGWAAGGLSLSATAGYGFGTASTSIATPAGPASAKRNVSAWTLGGQARYAVRVGSGEIGASAGVRSTSARLEAFTETGGSSPLLGKPKTVTATRLYAGLDAALPIALGARTTITPRTYARGGHDSGDVAGSADVVFASAPSGTVLTALGPGVGRWTAEVGGGIDVAIGRQITVWGSYDTQIKAHSDTRTARIGATLTF